MGLIDVGIYINGESVFGRLLKIYFLVGFYLDVFVCLFEVFGKWNNDVGLIIFCDDFGKGYLFFVFIVDLCGFKFDMLG